MPAVLTSVAERLASARPQAARRFGWLAMGPMAAVVAAALLTAGVRFFFGVSSCDIGPSPGFCAAGAGSLMNLLSVAALALSSA